jgi:hypothetical protein
MSLAVPTKRGRTYRIASATAVFELWRPVAHDPAGIVKFLAVGHDQFGAEPERGVLPRLLRHVRLNELTECVVEVGRDPLQFGDAGLDVGQVGVEQAVGAVRQWVFGDGRGLIAYLLLTEHDRVDVLVVTWVSFDSG